MTWIVKMTDMYKTVIRKTERKRPLEEPRYRRYEMYFKEMGCEGVAWVHLGVDSDNSWLL